MPIQKNGSAPVERGPGLAPPPVARGGTVELRLHGVGGTTPENLLDDLAPQQVSGDRIAGFYRTADRAGRHVEAYSWGGLTSRSASRVLWVLLLPFALANLAGWMCSPGTWNSGRRFLIHRSLVRLAALGMTVNLVLVTAMSSMDVIAYQCGAQPDCADQWWLSWLRARPLADHPSARVLVGAAVPLLLLIGLFLLARRSLGRYEDVEPPYKVKDGLDGAGPSHLHGTPDDRSVLWPKTTAARAGVDLADPNFWNGKRSVTYLAWLHIGGALAFLGAVTAYTSRAVPLREHLDVAVEPLFWASLACAAAALVLAVVLPFWSAFDRPLPIAALCLGGASFVLAAVLALAQPVSTGLAVDSAPGELPGMRLSINIAYGFCIGAVLAVGLATIGPSNRAVLADGKRERGFFAAGPFVALTLGVVILNGVGIGTMIRIADLLGNVPNPDTASQRPNSLYVYEIVYAVTPYLTLVPLAILILFGLFELITYWRAGWARYRGPTTVYDRMAPPDLDRLWNRSGLAARYAGKWTATTARARRLAEMPHDVDKLLTLMTFFAVVFLGYAWYMIWVRHGLPYFARWMLTMSTWLSAAAPIGVLLLLRSGWRGLDSRKHIGVIWDVATFWPRAYHPLAPPSYSERAVPELQRRLWYLHDQGGRTVLAAHSQGSVIALAALVQADRRPDDDCTALVTFGSPITKLYAWAFPAYFGRAALDKYRPRVNKWVNFYYLTDYIGGEVVGGGVNNERREDPQTCWFIYGQDPPALGRHSGYWSDAGVWAEVDRLPTCARPTPTAEATPEQTLDPALGPA